MTSIRIPVVGVVALDSPIHAGGNFSWREATHGGQRIPTATDAANIIRLARAIQPYRTKMGRAWNVTSWYRPDPWNARTPGADPNSYHKSGQAIDFWVEGHNGRSLANLLKDWPGGLGIYSHLPEIIHLDIGPRGRWGI